MLYFFVASATLLTKGGAIYGLYVATIVLAVTAKVWLKRSSALLLLTEVDISQKNFTLGRTLLAEEGD